MKVHIIIYNIAVWAIIVYLLRFIVLDTHNSNDYIKTLLDNTQRELEACNYERLLYLNKLMYENEKENVILDTIPALDSYKQSETTTISTTR